MPRQNALLCDFPPPQRAMRSRNARELELRPRRHTAAWCAVVFALGLTVRLGLVLPHPPAYVSIHEPVNIAMSLASRGAYADAYGEGTGPTAHAAPVHPLMLSVLFRAFGTGARGALAMSVLGSVE